MFYQSIRNLLNRTHSQPFLSYHLVRTVDFQNLRRYAGCQYLPNWQDMVNSKQIQKWK